MSSIIPAILGGKPTRPKGPPSWPPGDEDIHLALHLAWEDGSWGKYQGGNVERLENNLQAYHDVPFVATCASGTFAVESALRGLRVETGDEVILSAYDYPGNFLSIHALGAIPVLVDVTAHNWNLDVDLIQQAIGPKTKAILASHLHGGLVPMEKLMELARQNKVAVLEDAAQCPGAIVEGKKAGTWGDVGILSFGGSKLLTSGRGGAILTGRAEVHQRIRLALNRGNHICPLSELQAAVLIPQLEKLDRRNQKRSANVQLLGEILKSIPGLKLFVNRVHQSKPSYYKLGFQYAEEEFGLSRTILLSALRAEGIAFDEGFRGLHAGRSKNRFRPGSDLHHADQAHRGSVILHHPVLLEGEEAMAEIGRAIHKILDHVEQLSLLSERRKGP